MELPPANSLIAALAAGQPGSFAALYDRVGPSLLRVAGVMLRDAPEAEDAVQDVFVEIARRPDRLRHVVSLEAYLFAMLRNGIARRLRRREKELSRLRQLPPRDEPEKWTQSDDLNSALAALPDNQRELITLKIDAGMTFAQIAEVLNISPNTAASRYRYALEKLRSALEP